MVRGKRILKEWKLSTKDLCSKTKEKQKNKNLDFIKGEIKWQRQRKVYLLS